MQFTDKRIAETFDYARFEPSKSMEKIIAAFAEKFKTTQKNPREKISFDELSGENTAKTVNRPEKSASKNLEKKSGKSL